jgi:hypothetical protein
MTLDGKRSVSQIVLTLGSFQKYMLQNRDREKIREEGGEEIEEGK